MSQNEMQAIMNRLGEIHGDLQSTRTEVQGLCEGLDEVKCDVYGDGSDDNPGLKGRVMKLEYGCDISRRGGEHKWLIYAAVIGSLVMAASDLIARLVHP